MTFPMSAALDLSSRFRKSYVIFSLSIVFKISVIWIFNFPLTQKVFK